MLYLAYWNPLCLYVGINADFSSLKLALVYFRLPSVSNKLSYSNTCVNRAQCMIFYIYSENEKCKHQNAYCAKLGWKLH